MSSNEGQPDGKKKAAIIRQVVLIGILLVLGSLLAYDFLVARPAVNDAYNTVSEMLDDGGTRTEVVEKIGEPASTYQRGEFSIDKYTFRSGLIIRTHDVYVVYEKGAVHAVSRKPPLQMDLEFPDDDE